MKLTTNKPNRKGLNFVYIPLTGVNMEIVHTNHVVLYDTKIIETCNNSIRLNTNGFRTNHTKNCMNDFLTPLGIRVFQKNLKWYVDNNGTVIEFKDNIELEILWVRRN